MHSRPATDPMPDTRPPDGTCSAPYSPWPASWESSRKGEPTSSRASIRCRGSNLPREACSAAARTPPPCSATAAAAAITAACSSMRRTLPANAADEASTAPSRTACADRAQSVRRACDSDPRRPPAGLLKKDEAGMGLGNTRPSSVTAISIRSRTA
eukprot:scaffold5098_cov112-Isochrysis_galbana.AAC.2